MKKNTHFLGIGGIGMSALAHLLLEKGAEVSGEDQKVSPMVQALQKKGAVITNSCNAESQVVYSSAIQKDHPSLEKARQMNCSLYHRSQFLRKLMEGKSPLIVTGTHGKTSTSALLTWVLLSSGLSPSYAVGGILKNTTQNGGYGEGNFFVAEADESDGSFLNYGGEFAILTNLEKEHLDFWESEENLIEGFCTFANQVQGLYWCRDDTMLASLDLKGESYGLSDQANWRLFDVMQEGMKQTFSIAHGRTVFREIELPLVGKHQALNACAVWGLASELGISEAKIRKAFRTFQGVQRRLEKKGEVNGVTVYDDYAHHPTEVEVLLSSLKRAVGKKRLIAIFQPHRFTRTRDCMQGFSKAFCAADQVYITDIYSAGEKPIVGVTGKALASAIPDSIYLEALPKFMSGDVVVTIGAGDITHLGPQILESLK